MEAIHSKKILGDDENGVSFDEGGKVGKYDPYSHLRVWPPAT